MQCDEGLKQTENVVNFNKIKLAKAKCALVQKNCIY